MRLEDSERLLINELFENTRTRNEGFSLKPKEILPLTGDASTRRYYRVVTESNSYVSCLSEPKENNEESDFLNVYNILKSSNVRVPEIYDFNIKKGYFLQEDLGNITLLSYISLIQDEEEILETYKKVVDILINIHNIAPDREYPWGRLEFDDEKLMFEINFTKKYFFNSFLNVKFSENEEKLFDTKFSSMISEIVKENVVLCHRDFHSRNIMMKNNDPVVIDFQDARQGIAQYDLVSMLEDCYFQISPKNIKKLKKYYYDNAKNLNQDIEKFERLYDLMTVQRVFKAIGSFAYINEVREDNRYLKYIGFGMEKLRNKLKKYPEYKELYNLVMGKYYES